jgi:uncharacterized protein YjbJ (UPF0337 family)
MNRDQIKGVAKIVAGKVQEQTGKLIDSPEQIVKGVSRQIAGRFQKGRGDIKKTIKDFKRKYPAKYPA